MEGGSTGRTGSRIIAATAREGGAYILIFNILKNINLCIGTLGRHTLQRGVYIYVGSAKSGIGGRVRRHVRLSKLKEGGGKWHIDNLLQHCSVELANSLSFPGAEECAISGVLSSHEAIEAPVAGFGSSDCRSGCPAHLYRLKGKKFDDYCFSWGQSPQKASASSRLCSLISSSTSTSSR